MQLILRCQDDRRRKVLGVKLMAWVMTGTIVLVVLTVSVQVKGFRVSVFCSNVRIPQQASKNEHGQPRDIIVTLQ